ncbi:threonine synthase [Desulfurella sp.]|uniref:threonine synthase n=1 Tax=Desulfurella sp. TaxID=1962857 RepID=UPI0025BCE803|nr:threonine synthase [Desulfurella sp.]
MFYKSTRCGVDKISFKDAIMMGLATDGGLIVPEYVPKLSPQDLKKQDFKSIAFEIFKLYIGDIREDKIYELIDKSYSAFDDSEITPLKQFDDLYILELFHGPTYAFKDIALQFLGNLFEYILDESNQTLNVLGATSGDTGSAAIYGLKGKKNVKVFILYPKNGVSPTQELQMCDIEDENVFPIAINGTFDDCQNIIKEIFKDNAFKEKYHLGSINSINFARILAQIVYYYYAFLKVGENVLFSVPTGNFGDIFAGYLAKLMGLPVEKLILATNENDVLYRFVRFGDYSKQNVKKTLSPSMDIQLASNFERYIYYLYNQDCNKVKDLMSQLNKNGKLIFTDKLSQIQNEFSSYRVSDLMILQTIKDFYEKYNYIIDPHTACGVKAAFSEGKQAVCLATAHPAKFSEVIKDALGFKIDLPEKLAKLKTKKRNFEQENSIKAIKHFIELNANV